MLLNTFHSFPPNSAPRLSTLVTACRRADPTPAPSLPVRRREDVPPSGLGTARGGCPQPRRQRAGPAAGDGPGLSRGRGRQQPPGRAGLPHRDFRGRPGRAGAALAERFPPPFVSRLLPFAAAAAAAAQPLTRPPLAPVASPPPLSLAQRGPVSCPGPWGRGRRRRIRPLGRAGPWAGGPTGSGVPGARAGT